MIPFPEFWLPILCAAVAVFLVSSVLHMVLPYHQKDYGKLDNEEAVLAAMRDAGVRPGQYMFPCAGSYKEMSTPEMQEKLRRGPVGTMVVLPGMPAMGKSLGQWFVLCIVVCAFVAYLAALALPREAEFAAVFRFCATAAFMGFGLGAVTDSIWKGIRWGVTAKFLLDGLLYAAAAAAVLGWLWPAG